jgi:molybdopterin-binding protein
MKISARNKLKGKILEVKKGATTAHGLEIAPGQIVTASITNEAVEELGLKSGATAIAIVKDSDVMIAID